MIYIGIDPACAKQTALIIRLPDTTHAILCDTFDPVDLYTQLHNIKFPPGVPITLVVEAQKIYRGSRVKTQTVLELANRGGFFEGLILALLPDTTNIYRPTPQEWKGQVSADMYRKRALKKWPELAKLTRGMTTQEEEDIAHAYGLTFYKPKK